MGRIKAKEAKTCKVEGCGGGVIAKNCCEKHYRQIKKHGKIMPDRGSARCGISWCNLPHAAKGYCRKHYVEQVRKQNVKNGLCSGCGGKHPSVLFAGDERRELPLCENCYFRLTSMHSGVDCATLRELWEEQKGRCAYTGKILTLGVNTCVDHIISKSNGGKNLKRNLCWADRTINSIKLNLDRNEFITLCKKVVRIHGC